MTLSRMVMSASNEFEGRNRIGQLPTNSQGQEEESFESLGANEIRTASFDCISCIPNFKLCKLLVLGDCNVKHCLNTNNWIYYGELITLENFRIQYFIHGSREFLY